MNARNLILYQAYGHPNFLNEAIYSVLSLYTLEKNASALFQILIYTDKVEYLQQFLPPEIQYRNISPDELEQWKGTPHFVHRVKIKMIQDVIQHFDGNILYMDTDTVFRKSPIALFEKIKEGKFLMHENEGALSLQSNLLFVKLSHFFRKNNRFLGGKVVISSDFTMINAGVLGFSTEKLRPLISEVLALSDVLYASYPKHVMEQIAFSYYFSIGALPHTTEKEIYHYWFFKDYWKTLAVFFEKHKDQKYPELLSLIAAIDPEKIYTPPVKISFKDKIKKALGF